MEDEIARDHLNTLTSNVSQFRTDDAYCDIEIHVEDSVFKCHRLILAAASKYFHVMFGGKLKENSASEVTVKDVRPQIFDEIIRFIYTGKISINNSNLYQLVCASDFFELPSIAKLCLQYVQRNVGVLFENGVEMFSYTRATGKTTFSEIIGKYVCKNLDYISKTREFLEISFEDFIAILDLIPRSASTKKSQDVYMYAIMRWIRHTDRSSQDMKSHFKELLKRIDLVSVSSDCLGDLLTINIDDLIALKQNGVTIDEISPHLNAVDSELKEAVDLESLYVFLNSSSAYVDNEFVTSVFSLCDQSGEATDRRWIHSYQFDSTNFYNYMRTVVLDGSLYCLSYSKSPQSGRDSQIFRTSSSISLNSNSHLKPPPLILKYYEMCGRGKHIYLYNHYLLSETIVPRCPSDTSFSDEQLSRGIYLYDREVDIWLSVPPLKRKFENACLTCDEQMVYLIGGQSSYGYVQGYDHRTPEWISLPSTENEYDLAACCTHRNKIYVSGGYCTDFIEMYDPVAGKWRIMGQMKSDRTYHRIVSFLHSDCLVTVGPDLSQNSDIELYNVAENEWKSMTSLYQSVMDSDVAFKDYLYMIDMVSYRP